MEVSMRLLRACPALREVCCRAAQDTAESGSKPVWCTSNPSGISSLLLQLLLTSSLKKALFYFPDAAGPALSIVWHLFWQEMQHFTTWFTRLLFWIELYPKWSVSPQNMAQLFSVFSCCFPLPTWLQCPGDRAASYSMRRLQCAQQTRMPWSRSGCYCSTNSSNNAHRKQNCVYANCLCLCSPSYWDALLLQTILAFRRDRSTFPLTQLSLVRAVNSR